MKNVPAFLLAFALAASSVAGAADHPAADRTQQARRLLSDLSSSRFDRAEATFNDQMKKQLPEAKLAKVWKQLGTQVGPLKKIGKARQITAGEYQVVLVACTFNLTHLDAKVVYDAAGKVAGLFFVAPQPVAASLGEKRPAGTTEKELTVGSAPWALPGTLTLPQGHAPFPAVVLVAGSGPQDRDETIGPNKIFRDLAWGLAARGIAVLRYEKRTRRYPVKMKKMRHLTLNEETVADARAAVDLLAHDKAIDPAHIYVLGHSLGGTAAPRIATGDRHVAGLIILAGSTTPLEEKIVDQLRHIAALDGTVTAEEKARIEEAEAARRSIRDPKLSPDATVDVLGAETPGSYWLDLRSYHPATVAARLRIPMLILQGDRDYQVTAADFEGWKRALAGRSDVTFKTYPKLNHLFMTGEGPSSPAEYRKPGHVAPQVIADIATWVARQVL